MHRDGRWRGRALGQPMAASSALLSPFQLRAVSPDSNRAMSYPQGYLYQPPGSLALYSCPAYGASALAAPRSEDLARSSSGSAFSPYPGSAAFSASAGAGFSSPLSYTADPTAGFPPYMSSPYDAHATGMAGALSYHPYGSPGYPYQLNDPAYRKNATRDATATLKAWLQEHRKNPYPTKGEKIMLAIITKMTLTQVSTWFANARRRLKKENKMTNYTNYGNFSPLQGQGILRYTNSSGVNLAAAAAAAAANESLGVSQQALEVSTNTKSRPGSPLVKNNPNQIVTVEQQQQHFRPAHLEGKKGT
ncbi:unnamed protein product [Tetraodon nigroviridis]|uniref:(spotted green pufferfish) hypothetical protein n=1 Tax=Tetraodon nigroviridis TaxID=99883 RepID=Q4SRK2_TETNG|nr:unnamed protein product [Tetraodon nigroviridis]